MLVQWTYVFRWKNVYDSVADKYFAFKSALYHYYGTANKNYYEYLCEDMVKYKKYFYVLRPILACKWIEEKLVYYKELVDSMADDRNPDWDLLEDVFRGIVEGY